VIEKTMDVLVTVFQGQCQKIIQLDVLCSKFQAFQNAIKKIKINI